jgi:hypothetical protein
MYDVSVTIVRAEVNGVVYSESSCSVQRSYKIKTKFICQTQLYSKMNIT